MDKEFKRYAYMYSGWVENIFEGKLEIPQDKEKKELYEKFEPNFEHIIKVKQFLINNIKQELSQLNMYDFKNIAKLKRKLGVQEQTLEQIKKMEKEHPRYKDRLIKIEEFFNELSTQPQEKMYVEQKDKDFAKFNRTLKKIEPKIIENEKQQSFYGQILEIIFDIQEYRNVPYFMGQAFPQVVKEKYKLYDYVIKEYNKTIEGLNEELRELEEELEVSKEENMKYFMEFKTYQKTTKIQFKNKTKEFETNIYQSNKNIQFISFKIEEKIKEIENKENDNLIVEEFKKINDITNTKELELFEKKINLLKADCIQQQKIYLAIENRLKQSIKNIYQTTMVKNNERIKIFY